MVDRITLKHRLKWSAGLFSAFCSPVFQERRPHVAILNYHRVAHTIIHDPVLDDWNVPPDTFERQIRFLAEHAEVIRMNQIVERLRRPISGKPVVAISFDDGYASAALQALPVLCKYTVPATMFVVTNIVGQTGPMPFNRWSQVHASEVPPETTRPVSWQELEQCAASGLVDIGSHSHRHLNGAHATSEELHEEAALSAELLRKHLGEGFVPLYAYPYGSSRLGQAHEVYADAIRRAGFISGFTTDNSVVTAGTDPFFLPRLEAHPLDNPMILGAKTRGALAGYAVTQRMRSALVG